MIDQLNWMRTITPSSDETYVDESYTLEVNRLPLTIVGKFPEYEGGDENQVFIKICASNPKSWLSQGNSLKDLDDSYFVDYFLYGDMVKLYYRMPVFQFIHRGIYRLYHIDSDMELVIYE